MLGKATRHGLGDWNPHAKQGSSYCTRLTLHKTTAILAGFVFVPRSSVSRPSMLSDVVKLTHGNAPAYLFLVQVRLNWCALTKNGRKEPRVAGFVEVVLVVHSVL